MKFYETETFKLHLSIKTELHPFTHYLKLCYVSNGIDFDILNSRTL